MAKQSTPIAIKFSGSLALLLTIAGVLLALGGQLDFLGNERTQPAQPIAPKNNVGTDDKQPKYSFYDELKKRKGELDNQQTVTNNQPAKKKPETKTSNVYRYVVQVGAFRYEKDAKIVQRRVDNLGYPSRLAKGTRKFLVQAGPFDGMQNARQAEKRLRGQKMDTLIKRLK